MRRWREPTVARGRARDSRSSRRAARDRPAADSRGLGDGASRVQTFWRARHRVVRTRLARSVSTALVVTNPTNIRYLSNHAGSARARSSSPDRRVICSWISDTRKRCAGCRRPPPRARECGSGPCPELRRSAHRVLSSPRYASGSGFEAAHLSVAQEGMARTDVGVTWPDCELDFDRATSSNSSAWSRMPSEVAAARSGAPTDPGAPTAPFDRGRAGVTERDVAGAIEAAMRAAGYERHGVRHDCRVRSQRGPAALPRRRRGSSPPGDLVVLDFGGVLDGYCSDLTRTVSVGAPTARSPCGCTQLSAMLSALPSRQSSRACPRHRSMRPPAACSKSAGSARHSATAPVTASASMFTKNHGSARRGPDVQLPCCWNQAWSSPLSRGPTCRVWGGVRIEDDVLVTERRLRGADVSAARAARAGM